MIFSSRLGLFYFPMVSFYESSDFDAIEVSCMREMLAVRTRRSIGSFEGSLVLLSAYISSR